MVCIDIYIYVYNDFGIDIYIYVIICIYVYGDFVIDNGYMGYIQEPKVI